MQIKKVISNDAICQQRFLSSNIKWILNKKNKRDIKWHFRLHSVFYEAWGFFELFRSSSEELSSSLPLEYYASKFWWESWLSSWNSTFWIWAGLSAWGFVQSLLKWPGSPHLQHPSGHVGTAAQQSLQWRGSCWIESNNLAAQGPVASRVKAFWLIHWWFFSHQAMSDTTL